MMIDDYRENFLFPKKTSFTGICSGNFFLSNPLIHSFRKQFIDLQNSHKENFAFPFSMEFGFVEEILCHSKCHSHTPCLNLN